MRNKAFWKKRMITLAVTAALSVAAVTSGPAVTAWATPASGTAVVDNVVVRESAVSGSQIGGLSEGQAVTIVGETTGSDGKTWYQITYTVDGTEHSGWVRGDLLNTSDESLETNTADTDTDTSDADASGSDTDAGAADTDPEEGESVSLEFETKSGYIILTDVPEEERMLVSDRFVETSLDFAEGTIAAFQRAEPDALVADDAAIVDYYYVYGYNEVGETGWYVYNAEDGTIQKNLLNMQYSIAETAEEETEDSGTEFSVDSLTRMAFSTLGVICLLLLVITIIFSVRYRRLRRILEEEIAEDEQPAAREPDVKRGRQSNAKGSARHPSEEKAYMKIDQGADQQETGEKRTDAASAGTGQRPAGADEAGTGKGIQGAEQSVTGKG
ncbi:MAG: SH3 domain-containing protein, partial [Clostridiales bacterium]|nr:SH3 domain-containing protein [Clostridiales bacterium]